MEYDWDAIIIGGGPAGSTVARYAVEGGAKVLVIDRRKTIGTPLQCGELVPTNKELIQLCPDVPQINHLFQTPERAVSRRTTEMGLVTPSGKRLTYPFEGKIINTNPGEVFNNRAISLRALSIIVFDSLPKE